VDLQPVDLAAVREAQDRVMRVRDEQLLDEVLVLHRCRGLATAAAPLSLIFGERLTLCVSGVGERYDDVLRLDQILGREVEMIAIDLCAALVTVRFANLDQLIAYY